MSRLNISSSPHVRSRETTSFIMLIVIIALLPTSIFGIVNFGLRALVQLLVAVASAVLSELFMNKIRKQPVTIGDLSAVITGLLLGLNVPVSLPIWETALGSAFAIIIAKMMFGGLGQNFMNPALAGRCFLVIAFAADMTNFTCDAYSGATPLTALRAGESVNVMNMLIGKTGGAIGETSALCILIGAIIMIIFGVIDLSIPAGYLISFVLFMGLFGGHGFDSTYLVAQLCGGGLMLGVFFMATDYVTSPITPVGRVVYGVCCGVLTGLFRCFGANADGVSFAIILSNILVPVIEKFTVPTAFGVVRVREVKRNEKDNS